MEGNDPVEIDYGPLSGLIGSWEGRQGMDISPEPDGTEENPYYETIDFEAAGDVFHDQIGYWLWDAGSGTVIQTVTIPRGVSVIAGGSLDGAAKGSASIVIEVAAKLGDPDWGIVQSPFMRDNASTLAFRHKITLAGDRLSYAETTRLEIYGRHFEHTDENELVRT